MVKFSIITAVYNNVHEIEHAIQSVLSQSYTAIEYIVVDGNSGDGTTEIIKQYSPKISHFISEPDKGIYYALNKGISLATGDIIGILHSDDVFFDKTVIEKLALIFENTNCDATYGDLWYVSKTDSSKIIRYWKSCPFNIRNFYKGWMPAHPTLFMKKVVYDKFGVFDTKFRIAADYDLMLRTLGSGKLRCEYLPEVITCMRIGGTSNKSIKNIYRKSYEDWRALRKNKKGGFYTLFLKNFSKLTQFQIFRKKLFNLI